MRQEKALLTKAVLSVISDGHDPVIININRLYEMTVKGHDQEIHSGAIAEHIAASTGRIPASSKCSIKQLLDKSCKRPMS